MQVIFTTARLILRQFTEEDAQLIYKMNSDPEVLKYLHEPQLMSELEATEILRDIILPQYKKKLGRWAIHKKNDNSFIGWCGLKFRPELNEIDLGYRFIRSEWGNGYATEAAGKTLDYGFSELSLKAITGRAHVENIASIKVLEKIGMRFVREGMIDNCMVRTYLGVNPLK